MCRVAAECAHGCCRMCAGLQSYQIFSQISQKYFLAQKNILSKKWPPKQNLKGVSKSYIGLCNHSGPLHKVTWWCMVVREVPKALLKMASGLISPSGHCGQLCNDPKYGCWYLASSGDMMEVADSLKALASPSSCFTRPMVGVMGRDLTGTGRVSAVTTRVSAFTWDTRFVR